MLRISLPYIFNLATQLEPLASLPERETPYRDVFLPLFVTEGALNGLVQAGLYAAYLRSSQPLGQDFLNAIRNKTSKNDFDLMITEYDLWQIRNGYSQYKIVLLAELGSLDAYFVTQKGPFDSTVLLAYGEALFPADLQSKVPDAIFDCRETGKCLAYEVPTAAGFHAFRATESVLRKYYAQITGGAAPPKVRSIGVYVSAMERAQKGDPKILAVLKQLNTLHRNPLIHPEIVLTADEAIAIVGIARSAVTAMLAVLPAQPPTTLAAQAAPISPTSSSP